MSRFLKDSTLDAGRSSSRNRMVSSVWVFVYLLVVSSPVLVATLTKPQTGHAFAGELGKNFGLLGIGILLIQFVLAARLSFLNRCFGLDSLLIFHRSMGIFGLLLLVAHPVVLAAEGNWRLLYALDSPWYIAAGKVALLALVAHIIVSVFREALKLSYERWRILHNVLALAILSLALAHSWFAGGDLGLLSMRILWVSLAAAAFGGFFWHRFVRPQRLASQPYRVAEVRAETSDVWTLRLEPPNGLQSSHLPGQFHFLTFIDSDAVPREEHHFTISSSPTDKQFLESTIKASGDFTSAIRDVRPGDSVSVHGNFGHFSYLLIPGSAELVFIAGGIGITPLMSMLRHMRETGSQRQITLIYGNKIEADIVFHDEISEMASSQNPPLRVLHVISQPEASSEAEIGYIDGENLDQLFNGKLSDKQFFICGPAAMAKSVVSALREREVPSSNIHAESFSLLRDSAPTNSRSRWRKWITVGIVISALAMAGAAALIRGGESSSAGGHHDSSSDGEADGHSHSHSSH